MMHSVRRTHLVAALSVALVVVGAVVGVLVSTWSSIVGEGDGIRWEAASVESTFVRDYESLGEMLQEPGAVVILGRVENVVLSELRGGIRFTDTKVELKEVLYGALVDPNTANVIVRQMGGHNGKVGVVYDQERLLGRGEEVMLVLTYDASLSRYFIVGAFNGYFLVEGGKIENANLKDSAHWLHEGYANDRHPLSEWAKSVDASDLRVVVGSADDSDAED